MRVAMLAAVLCVGACFGGRARAQLPAPGEKISKKVCIAAAERGQELRDGNQLRDARAQFSLCARSECPARISAECKRWAAEAEAAIASVRLEVVDANGRQHVAGLDGVRVFVDDKPWTDEISKEPLLLDPGSHEIRLERAGSPSVTRAVTLAMGERDRVLRFAMVDPARDKPAPASAPVATTPAGRDEDTRGSIAVPIALGAFGLVALGAAGTFWVLGNSELEDARARCTARCASTEADGARTKHLVGDIALGVGVVSLGVATVLLITRPARRPPTTANVSLVQIAGGAVGAVEGRF